VSVNLDPQHNFVLPLASFKPSTMKIDQSIHGRSIDAKRRAAHAALIVVVGLVLLADRTVHAFSMSVGRQYSTTSSVLHGSRLLSRRLSGWGPSASTGSRTGNGLQQNTRMTETDSDGLVAEDADATPPTSTTSIRDTSNINEEGYPLDVPSPVLLGSSMILAIAGTGALLALSATARALDGTFLIHGVTLR
jgi:hypothetical protein